MVKMFDLNYEFNNKTSKSECFEVKCLKNFEKRGKLRLETGEWNKEDRPKRLIFGVPVF